MNCKSLLVLSSKISSFSSVMAMFRIEKTGYVNSFSDNIIPKKVLLCYIFFDMRSFVTPNSRGIFGI